ncbi:MAG: hypothetical protein KDC84_15370 [Crocinitomicaceae bacterium]|nr:hypothetical protein [Crocinitomicaceae bacterium]
MDKAMTKEGSFARDMFERMYDSLFSELIDLRQEYKKYYALEYERFEIFLYKKYNLEPDDIEAILKVENESEEYTIYKKDDFAYGDYGIAQFCFSEVMYGRILNLLLLKKDTDEN